MEQATATGNEPNPLDNTGLCLLSLDGGGVRGLSSLLILKGIMDRLNFERNKIANLPPVKPCEVFDLIGGTSTGGLIAIMLGRLEMNVDECITAYIDLAENVFGQKKSYLPLDLIMGNMKARFDSSKLEKAILDTIKKAGSSETALFDDGNERGCKTFVCTVDQSTKTIVRLRSYGLPDESNIPATICQAALATSAATTFFDPVRIGNRTFADGGLGANNPVDEVEGEAMNIWCSKTADLKPLVKCFLSIGTGNPGIKAFETSLRKFLSQTVVDIATETEETERKFIAKWRKHFDENRYFRFNVDQGLQAIGLDEYNKKGEMEAATDRYLTNQAQKSRVRDCIQNLKLKQNRTEPSFAALMQEYTVFNSRQPSANQTSWIVPLARNPNFTGRESQLAQLEEKLFGRSGSKKVAVIGLGGVGKTQLVLQFVYQFRAKHNDCSIIWIPATNMESLQQAYLDVAQRLCITGYEEDKADVKRLVQDYLSKESAGQWLVVYDNADDMNLWFDETESKSGSGQLIDYLPKSEQGHIVFTSRDRKTAVKLAHQNIVEVPEMGEDVATVLLQKCLIDPDLVNNTADTRALLEELTNLPLAIVQAAAYINENNITFADYLSLLAAQEEEVIEVLSEEFEDDWRYRDVKNPVAITWLISFEQILHRDPLAADYLSFMACIHPKDIPQSLLPPGPSRKKETDAIGTLNAYSFIVKRSVDEALDLHRLVHLATRNWLRKQDLLAGWTDGAIARLDEVFPDDDYRKRSLWRIYLPHARYIIQSNDINKDKKKRLNLVWKSAICLHHDGRWHEANSLYWQAMEIRKRVLGKEHPETLTSMSYLATTSCRQGKWDDAEKLDLEVLEIRKKVLGLDHIDTLRSMSSLAVTYTSQGRWKAAEKLHLQVMSTCMRVFEPDCGITLSSISNLAWTYLQQGRWNEAETLFAQAVEMGKKVLDEDHPTLMVCMNNLLTTYTFQGRWKEAEELAAKVMETRKRVLGPEHPDTLATISSLATVYLNQGRLKEAEELQVQVMETKKRVLGPEHLETSATTSNLAVTYFKQGRLKEAEELQVQVMEIGQRILGPEHPATLSYMSNLMRFYMRQRRWEEAAKLGAYAMEARKRVLGPEHPETLTTISNLGSIYIWQGRLKEAEELEVYAMETMKRVFGPEHIETLVSASNLGLVYREQGRLKEAEELQVQWVEPTKRILGPEHPDTLTMISNLVLIYKNQKRWEEAEKLGVYAMEARKRKLGPEDPDTLGSMYQLALIFKESGEDEKGMALMGECIRGRRETLGPDHPTTKNSEAWLNHWRMEVNEGETTAQQQDSKNKNSD